MTTNTGTLQNTYNYLVPAAGTTRGYRVTKEFVPGQIEVCDFRNMALDGVSFVPSGVLIDNTRGVDNCVVTILEYSWRIVIPAGQFAHMPYPAPYNQTATIEGNAPELTVVFVDYPVIPFFSGSSSGGGSVGGITDIIAGDGISIDKTDTNVPVISATGGGGGGGGLEYFSGTLEFTTGLSTTPTMPSNNYSFIESNSGVYDSGTFTLPEGDWLVDISAVFLSLEAADDPAPDFIMVSNSLVGFVNVPTGDPTLQSTCRLVHSDDLRTTHPDGIIPMSFSAFADADSMSVRISVKLFEV